MICDEMQVNEIPVSVKLHVLNSEEYWPVLIGLIWFLGVTVCTVFGVPIAHVQQWTYVEELEMAINPLMIVVIAGTLFTLLVTHWYMVKPQALLHYSWLSCVVLLCKIIGSHSLLHSFGLGDSVWQILFGMLIGNICHFFNVSFKNLLSLEFFIKIGIVLLAMDASQFASNGGKGLVVAWFETCAILIFIYWFGVKIMKMERTEAIVTACGASICGSSAAMAISETVKASKEMTMSLIALMSLFTIPFIPLIPFLARTLSLNDMTTGAMIGGSVDSTGAVLACASLSGPNALRAAIVVKMLQNVLIGPITLIITMIFHNSFRFEVLWQKFPKFVIGFMLVCLFTTTLQAFEVDVTNNSFIMAEWFTGFSFVLIGIDINFFTLCQRLSAYKKVWILYILAQLLDILTTFGTAYFMFTYIQ